MRDDARQIEASSGSSSRRDGPINMHLTGQTNTIAKNEKSGPSMTIIVTIATCLSCLIFLTNIIIVVLFIHRRNRKQTSKLKRIPGAESLVKYGISDTFPSVECYPERFLTGQNVFGSYADSGSQKDNLSQHQFEHFNHCPSNIPTEYISSGSYFHPESPINMFVNSSGVLCGNRVQEHPLQMVQRINSLSQSSSPLHSSRSHGMLPDASDANLIQRHPGAVYSDQQSQSIYLVAAPNPVESPLRYRQDVSDGTGPIALYLNSDNLGINGQCLSHGGNIGLRNGHTNSDSNHGTVSPQSTTGKSISSEKGLVQEHMQRVASYVNQSDSINPRSGGSQSVRMAFPHGSISTRIINQQNTYTSSPRMVSSFYNQRMDPNSPQSALGSAGSQERVARRNSCAHHQQNDHSTFKESTLVRKQRPLISYANDAHSSMTNYLQAQNHLNDSSNNEFSGQNMFTLNDISTIPPPTDFSATTNLFPVQDDGRTNFHLPDKQSELSHRYQNHQLNPNNANGNNAWFNTPGCLSTRVSNQRGLRGSIIPEGQQAFIREPEKTGVHFELSM